MNVNKVATLRNARGGDNPDVVATARALERFGAQGITVHPRPDERHIRRSDVRALRSAVTTEFNIEGYPSDDFLALVSEVRPHQVTFVPDPPDVLTSNAGWDARAHKVFLRDVVARMHAEGIRTSLFLALVSEVRPHQVTFVPDPPDVLTSNAGWDTRTHKSFLRDVVARMHAEGIRTSLFLAPDPEQTGHAADTGTDRIELYTEAYARGFAVDRESALDPYRRTAAKAQEMGLGINAGHDLDRDNLRYFHLNIPGLLEVSIGHALVCDALWFGWENTVQLYLRELRP